MAGEGEYPREAAFSEENAAVVFDRYHAPGFVLRNDGLPMGRDALVAHMRPAAGTLSR